MTPGGCDDSGAAQAPASPPPTNPPADPADAVPGSVIYDATGAPWIVGADGNTLIPARADWKPSKARAPAVKPQAPAPVGPAEPVQPKAAESPKDGPAGGYQPMPKPSDAPPPAPVQPTAATKPAEKPPL